MRFPESYKIALQIQRLIKAKAAEAKTPKELADLARALCELEEMKRRIRQKPLPKPIDVPRNGPRYDTKSIANPLAPSLAE